MKGNSNVIFPNILPRPFSTEKKMADLEKVARDFEALFLYILLREMKKSTSLFKKSFAEDAYMDILYEKVASHLAGKGTKISDLISKYLSKERTDFTDKKREGEKIG